MSEFLEKSKFVKFSNYIYILILPNILAIRFAIDKLLESVLLNIVIF